MKLIFRVIAVLEALSWIALLFTMYLKYAQGQPEPNQITGMAHGVLFMLYVVLAIQVAPDLSWSRRQLLVALIASLIPGATIYVERRMLA